MITADPLLCSSVEAAIGCMFYEVNCVGVSIGNTLRATNEIQVLSPVVVAVVVVLVAPLCTTTWTNMGVESN